MHRPFPINQYTDMQYSIVQDARAAGSHILQQVTVSCDWLASRTFTAVMDDFGYPYEVDTKQTRVSIGGGKH